MLKAIRNLQLLINLFHQREIVTLKEAVKLCNISERSFYRYINTLSETNIPIYYDYSKKGYRLSLRTKSKKIEYSSQEICYMLAALHQFNSKTLMYKDDYIDLRNKIQSLATFNLDDLFSDLHENTFINRTDSKMDSYLTKAFIFLATTQGFPVLVKYTKNSQVETVKIENPSIEFKGTWSLIDKKFNISIPHKSIVYIRLLE